MLRNATGEHPLQMIKKLKNLSPNQQSFLIQAKIIVVEVSKKNNTLRK